jgi:hypothetical protein
LSNATCRRAVLMQCSPGVATSPPAPTSWYRPLHKGSAAVQVLSQPSERKGQGGGRWNDTQTPVQCTYSAPQNQSTRPRGLRGASSFADPDSEIKD